MHVLQTLVFTSLVTVLHAAKPQNSVHINRANFMIELWTNLSPIPSTLLPSSTNQVLSSSTSMKDIPFDSRVISIEKGIRNHVTLCKDLGLIQYKEFVNTPYAFINLQPKSSSFQIPILDTSTSDETIVSVTRNWVKSLIAGFGVCPFTIDDNLAGIPRGKIHYAVSNAVTFEQAFADYWKQVAQFLSTDSTSSSNNQLDISTVLLMFSQVSLFANIKDFENFCECLDDSLRDVCVDFAEQIQLVYFHPKFEFVDKDAQG